jgi:hypothetical protein
MNRYSTNKYLLVLCPLLTGSLFNSLFPENVPLRAQIHNVLMQVSARDAQLLLNLTYWSTERSRATLQAQKELLANLKTSWALWQNCVQTRLNPSKESPYAKICSLKASACNRALRKQIQTNKTYAHMIDCFNKQPLLEHEAAQKLCATLRSEAHLVLSHALLNCLATFETELASTHHLLELAMNIFGQSHKNFITDGITALLEEVGIPSFAKFDTAYNESSDTIFQGLWESQQLFTRVWEQLETERAQFFSEAFVMIRDEMIALKFPSKSFLCAFDEDGLIAASQQIIDLAASAIETTKINDTSHVAH